MEEWAMSHTVTFISGNNDHVDLTAANEWKA